MIDASLIALSLFQGGKPPTGLLVAQAGFDVLVLCAEEYQPEASLFPGVRVIHAPNDDSFTAPPTRAQLGLAVMAARQVSAAVQEGERVLVTCMQGRNRSGLVSAIALHLLTGCEGLEAAFHVQRQRQRRALRNPGFLECLSRLRGTAEGNRALLSSRP